MITAAEIEKHYEEVCKFRGKTGFFCPIGDCEAFLTDGNLQDHFRDVHVQAMRQLIIESGDKSGSKACVVQ
jgi:hypothetical protein